MLLLKLVVYALITVNFGFYALEDWTAAQHELTESSGIFDVIAVYTTSLNDFAWIALLLMFEVETYWLDDDFDNPPVEGLMSLFKIVLLALVLQSTVAFTSTVLNGGDITPIEETSDLCQLLPGEYSFYRNLEYTGITPQNCGSISHDGKLVLYPGDRILTDAEGFREDRMLSALDLVENLSWLLIVILVQTAVMLQNRGIYEGFAITWVTRGKLLGYAGILGASIVWIYKGHYLYAWDEFLWIAGFSLLEKNLSQWRSDLAVADAR